MENERADARQDSRTCLTKPNFHPRTGTWKSNFGYSPEHKQDWRLYPFNAQSAEHHHNSPLVRVESAISYKDVDILVRSEYSFLDLFSKAELTRTWNVFEFDRNQLNSQISIWYGYHE